MAFCEVKLSYYNRRYITKCEMCKIAQFHILYISDKKVILCDLARNTQIIQLCKTAQVSSFARSVLSKFKYTYIVQWPITVYRNLEKEKAQRSSITCMYKYYLNSRRSLWRLFLPSRMPRLTLGD